jgi:hypothetical protein
LPLTLFKQPQEKADDEFRQAYEKGVHLGPQKWPDASHHFSEASKHYATVGNVQKSGEALALATLFYALANPSDQAWLNCSQAFGRIPDTQINVGFSTQSSSLAQQAIVQSYDLAISGKLDAESKDASRVDAVRDLAQKYMTLIGSDLSLWKLRKQEMDPQKRAYYLLGIASLIQANSIAEVDPKKSVSLLSEAATYLEMAGTEQMSVFPVTRTKLENWSKIGRCWFCGREMQGQGIHYVLLRASVSQYTRQKYGSNTPPTMEDNMVVACNNCASSIRNVADDMARIYFDRAIAEMRSLEQRLNTKIASLESQISSLRSQVSSIRARV